MTWNDVEHGDPDVGCGRHLKEERPQVHEGQHGPAVQHEEKENIEEPQIIHVLANAERCKADDQHDGWNDVVDHVPTEGGQPEVDHSDPTHKLDVFSLHGPLFDKEQGEAAGKESHAKTDIESQRETLKTLIHLVVDDVGISFWQWVIGHIIVYHAAVGYEFENGAGHVS